MEMEEVRRKAKALATKTAQIKKADLIREIQRGEGNFDYFGTATNCRDQWDCYFGEDRLPSPKYKRNK